MEKIDELLQKKSSSNFKKAAKIVAKEGLTKYATVLFSYLEESIEDPKRWETSCELINALGVVKHTPLIKLIEPVLQEKKEHDMVTMVSATAYVRLTRKDIYDASSVLKLINNNCYSITEGALEALGYDKMVPPDNQQVNIIKLCWDFGINRNTKAFTDPRYGLAAACAGWEVPSAKQFLEHCLESDDVPLNYVANNSLKGKYVKLR
jgi:hypothetical protein